MSGLARLRLLVALALRGVWSHKVKSLVVGSIVLFGTALLVIGVALLDSVERSMAQSVTASLAGHVQVYSADARDPLALFGGAMMGAEDIGEIDDFSPVKEALVEIPGVRSVVPMGITFANVSRPGDLDQVLQRLRDEVRAEDTEAMTETEAQVRQIVKDMLDQRRRMSVITEENEELLSEQRILERAAGDAFWTAFREAPLEELEWLDTRLAPLGTEGEMVFLRMLGTDLDAFAASFDRFRIIEGQAPPPGRRGVLISQLYWEQMLQNPVARDLDLLHEGVAEGRSIATDPKLSQLARRLPTQYGRITYQLEPAEARRLDAALKAHLPEVEGGLAGRLKAFLTVDDATVAERRRVFQELVVPMIDLHWAEIGDVLTLRAYTDSGYMKSVNVPVWGVFTFEGLEGADLAGAQNLVDIVTFRELYGRMSERKRQELAGIREAVGARDVGREDAEAELFGEGADLEVEAEGNLGFDEFAGAELETTARGQVDDRVYDQAEIDRGLALNVAVILDDLGRVDEAIAAIHRVSEEKDLGVQAVDWQTASGMVGQMITVIRIVLYVAIFIIFGVALVIINNSMVIATLERVGEIGTLRAIGAQRSFVMAMFLIETLVLCLAAGGLGALAGAGVVSMLGEVGISAGGEDVLVFLFSGPRLYPAFGPVHLVIGFVAILLVTLASTLYPARIATRIQPVVAMQGAQE